MTSAAFKRETRIARKFANQNLPDDNAQRAPAQPQHALLGKQSVCKLTNAALATLVLPDVRLSDTATCAECLEVLRIAEEAQEAARETPTSQEVARETSDAAAVSDACPPDCAESCCRPEAFGGVDVEEWPTDDFTPEPETDKPEAMLVLYTSAPATVDLPGTVMREAWTGTLGDDAAPLTVRRVEVPESMLKAQRLAYVAIPNTLNTTATGWAIMSAAGQWHHAPVSVPAATPAPIVPPAPADTPDAPEATSAPVDHLIYTTAPEDCDLRRTETVDAEAGVHHGRTVRLVRLDPQDVVRQTRIYINEDGCIAIEPAEWQRYEAAELALDAYVMLLKTLAAQDDATIKAALRSGEVRFADMPAPATPATPARRIQTDGAAPKAAKAPKAASDGTRSMPVARCAKAPNGADWPVFVVTPGPKDTSEVPAEYAGKAVGYCACGARYYGDGQPARHKLCETHLKARDAERLAFVATLTPAA